MQIPEIDIKFIDATNWQELFWYNSGGTRAKSVLQDPLGNEYYFKCSEKKAAKDGKPAKHYKYEFWSEIIAYQLGKQLGLDILRYDIALFNGEIGCISPKMTVTDDEQLLEIGRFMTALNPDFLPEDYATRTEYTFQLLEAPIASGIKDIVSEATIDNFHLKIEALHILFENANLEDDDKKMTIDELSDFANQLIHYKTQNIKPTLNGFKSAIALGLTNNSNSKEIGVCLSTVHTMKGQESDIVFLIGMDDGTFPDFRAVNKGGEDLQQEKNNTYVAFIRAKRFLYVTYPKKRLMPWGDYKPRTISRFLTALTN